MLNMMVRFRDQAAVIQPHARHPADTSSESEESAIGRSRNRDRSGRRLVRSKRSKLQSQQARKLSPLNAR